MYAKIFEQIYDGTLCSVGPWEALVTFQQLLILADSEGNIDMTPVAISRRTTIPISLIEIGIEALLQPDPDSRTPDEDGRRIIPLSDKRKWGWRIVNYTHYRNLRDEESRREYHRNYWHKRKEKLNSTQQTQPPQPPQPELDQSSKQRQEAEEETQAQNILDDFPKTKKLSNDISADFETAWGKYPARAGGNSKQKALKAWLARLTEGVSPAVLIAGVERYAEFVRATDKLNTEYVKQTATFFGPDKHYAEEWRPPAKILKPNFESHHSKPSHKEFPQ